MRAILRLFLIITIISGCSSGVTPTPTPQPATETVLPSPTNTSVTQITRVLFIGNSYTYGNDMPEMFAGLARSGGHDVEVGMVAEGGWRLSDHAQSMETLDKLKSSRWTFVVLQEQSQIPASPAYRNRDMYPAARQLVLDIREIGATPIFFLTWGHREGWPERRLNDYQSMQMQLQEGYETIAQELDVIIAPVGLAWQAAVQENPQLNLWRDDGRHPRKQGSYLAACVFYATIFQESPAGLAYYADLSEEVAQTLQSIASKTVLGIP